MKSTAIICAIAASLGLGSMAFAQSYDRGDGDRQGYEQRNHDQRQNAQRDRQQRNRMGNNADNRNYDREYNAHNWQRGSRIPDEYRSRQYVVNDWHRHGLRQPPRGYQWVQVGGDYVLVAIATGIIAQLLLNQ
ncbi:MAG: RcnB family protein [Ramlibacter sp.]